MKHAEKNQKNFSSFLQKNKLKFWTKISKLFLKMIKILEKKKVDEIYRTVFSKVLENTNMPNFHLSSHDSNSTPKQKIKLFVHIFWEKRKEKN